ncbi:ABC transporter ATP-binding protein [Helicobacter cappadocius]|uniref:ABC transporter ATP-binding protein n=1 Tax=Helicobacter cappadocius TaxID=3063998 RepID=A0AA90PTY6_9HELI|nr:MULTISPECIES: ABC transporter ATP-binding protein [unclassified Helicobacter]MDO7253944.1 ABC transporter ATP-binding protein [Helicobacter sp. faydin-H75]MDP2538690.1 ABC transporter ATP-binding protein [Helicobacter sp. faydin-H76]
MKKQKKNSTSDLYKLRYLITRRDKIILLWLFLATIVFSVVETLGISIIMPFITFASNPDRILNTSISFKFYQWMHFSSTLNFMLFFSGALVVFYIFRAFYSIFYNYSLNRFAFGKSHYFAYRLFCKSTELSYFDFTKKNTDKIRVSVGEEAQNVSQYIQNFLQMFAEVFTIALMYVLLLLVSWKMTLVLTVIMALQILFIIKTVSKKIKKQGDKRAMIETQFGKIITQTFGNFKFIKLKGNQKEIYEVFERTSSHRANIFTKFQTLNSIPKSFLETIGFILLISCVAYILVRYNDVSAVIPIISMYALALYRILPSANKILTNYNAMSFYKKALSNVYENLTYQTELEDNKPCEFEKSIELKNVSFAYNDSKPVIENFNLIINKGDKVAFCGPSGAGKSTLVDIIIGIYKPKKGEIFIDGFKLDNHNLPAWRKKIGYIPQTIYLFDGNVAENVAFGSEMNKEKLISACKKANIWEFLEQHNGLETIVGEGGILLSGGQKQRIGIARAIYDDPEILVLDEATSALDTDTEEKIMNEIYDVAKNKTLLVIAHRLNTIKRCNKKIDISLSA